MADLVPELPELLTPFDPKDVGGYARTLPRFGTNAVQWVGFADNGDPLDALRGVGYTTTRHNGSYDLFGAVSYGPNIPKPYMFVGPSSVGKTIVGYWEWLNAPIFAHMVGYPTTDRGWATNSVGVYCWDIRPMKKAQRDAFKNFTIKINHGYIYANSQNPFVVGTVPPFPLLEARIPDRVVDWADMGPYYDQQQYVRGRPFNAWEVQWMPKDSWSPAYTQLGDPRWSRLPRVVDDTLFQGYDPAFDPNWMFLENAPWGWPPADTFGVDEHNWDGDPIQLKDNVTPVWEYDPRKLKGGEWAFPPKDFSTVDWTTISSKQIVANNLTRLPAEKRFDGPAWWTIPVDLDTMVHDGRLVVVVGTPAQLDCDVDAARLSYLQGTWDIIGPIFELSQVEAHVKSPMMGFPVAGEYRKGRGQFRPAHLD